MTYLNEEISPFLKLSDFPKSLGSRSVLPHLTVGKLLGDQDENILCTLSQVLITP